jgi:hypothetical protein
MTYWQRDEDDVLLDALNALADELFAALDLKETGENTWPTT